MLIPRINNKPLRKKATIYNNKNNDDDDNDNIVTVDTQQRQPHQSPKKNNNHHQQQRHLPRHIPLPPLLPRLGRLRQRRRRQRQRPEDELHDIMLQFDNVIQDVCHRLSLPPPPTMTLSTPVPTTSPSIDNNNNHHHKLVTKNIQRIRKTACSVNCRIRRRPEPPTTDPLTTTTSSTTTTTSEDNPSVAACRELYSTLHDDFDSGDGDGDGDVTLTTSVNTCLPLTVKEVTELISLLNLMTEIVAYHDDDEDENDVSSPLEQPHHNNDNTNTPPISLDHQIPKQSTSLLLYDIFNSSHGWQSLLGLVSSQLFISSSNNLPLPPPLIITALKNLLALLKHAPSSSFYLCLSHEYFSSILKIDFLNLLRFGDGEGCYHYVSLLLLLATRVDSSTLPFYLEGLLCLGETTTRLVLYERALELQSWSSGSGGEEEEDFFVRVSAVTIILLIWRLAMGPQKEEDDETVTSVSSFRSSYQVKKSFESSRWRLSFQKLVAKDANDKNGSCTTRGGVGGGDLLQADREVLLKYLCQKERVKELIMPMMGRFIKVLKDLEDGLRRRDDEEEEEIEVDGMAVRTAMENLQDELVMLDEFLKVGIYSINKQIIQIFFVSIIYPYLLQPLLVYYHQSHNHNNNSSSQSSIPPPAPNDNDASRYHSVFSQESRLDSPPQQHFKHHSNRSNNTCSSDATPPTTTTTTAASASPPDTIPVTISLITLTCIFHTITSDNLLRAIFTILFHPHDTPPSTTSSKNTPPSSPPKPNPHRRHLLHHLTSFSTTSFPQLTLLRQLTVHIFDAAISRTTPTDSHDIGTGFEHVFLTPVQFYHLTGGVNRELEMSKMERRMMMAGKKKKEMEDGTRSLLTNVFLKKTVFEKYNKEEIETASSTGATSSTTASGGAAAEATNNKNSRLTNVFLRHTAFGGMAAMSSEDSDNNNKNNNNSDGDKQQDLDTHISNNHRHDHDSNSDISGSNSSKNNKNKLTPFTNNNSGNNSNKGKRQMMPLDNNPVLAPSSSTTVNDKTKHVVDMIASLCVAIVSVTNEYNGCRRLSYDTIAAHALVSLLSRNTQLKETARNLLEVRRHQSSLFFSQQMIPSLVAQKRRRQKQQKMSSSSLPSDQERLSSDSSNNKRQLRRGGNKVGGGAAKKAIMTDDKERHDEMIDVVLRQVDCIFDDHQVVVDSVKGGRGQQSQPQQRRRSVVDSLKLILSRDGYNNVLEGWLRVAKEGTMDYLMNLLLCFDNDETSTTIMTEEEDEDDVMTKVLLRCGAKSAMSYLQLDALIGLIENDFPDSQWIDSDYDDTDESSFSFFPNQKNKSSLNDNNSDEDDDDDDDDDSNLNEGVYLAPLSSSIIPALFGNNNNDDDNDDDERNDGSNDITATGAIVSFEGKQYFPCLCHVSEEHVRYFAKSGSNGGRRCAVDVNGMKWQRVYLVVLGSFLLLAEPVTTGDGGHGTIITSCLLINLCLKGEYQLNDDNEDNNNDDNNDDDNNTLMARKIVLKHTSLEVTPPRIFSIISDDDKMNHDNHHNNHHDHDKKWGKPTQRKRNNNNMTESEMTLWFRDDNEANFAYDCLSKVLSKARSKRGRRFREVLSQKEWEHGVKVKQSCTSMKDYMRMYL